MKYKLKHIKKAYRRIARYASEKKKEQYKTYPFWCSYTDIGINCIAKGEIKLTLNVPDNYVLLSNYDIWVEYLDYSENDMSKFRESYVDQLFEVESCKRIQSVIPYIKKEWVIGIQE